MAHLVSSDTEVLENIQAANPWNNGLPTQFNICVQYKGGLVPSHAAMDKRSRLQGYFIYSPAYKTAWWLPDALAKLWLDGEVAGRHLPEILHLMEDRPEKKDITPFLTLNATQRTVRVVCVILLGIIIGCLGWLLQQEGLAWGLALSACGVFLSILYLAHLQRMKERRKSLKEWILAQLILINNRRGR